MSLSIIHLVSANLLFTKARDVLFRESDTSFRRSSLSVAQSFRIHPPLKCTLNLSKFNKICKSEI